MSLRIHLMFDSDSPLEEKRLEREPPVSTGVKIGTRMLATILDATEASDIDGERIATLLGADDTADPHPRRGTVIDSDEDKRELLALLERVMWRLQQIVDTKYDLLELRFGDDTPHYRSVLNDEDLERLEAFKQTRKIRDQLSFALEHDIDLKIL